MFQLCYWLRYVGPVGSIAQFERPTASPQMEPHGTLAADAVVHAGT
jgi:hypothetical protein